MLLPNNWQLLYLKILRFFFGRAESWCVKELSWSDSISDYKKEGTERQKASQCKGSSLRQTPVFEHQQYVIATECNEAAKESLCTERTIVAKSNYLP